VHKLKSLAVLLEDVKKIVLRLLSSNHGLALFFSDAQVVNHLISLLRRVSIAAVSADEKHSERIGATLTAALFDPAKLTAHNLALIIGYFSVREVCT